MNKVKKIFKNKGFTLVEVLLIIGFMSMSFLGIYIMQKNTSDEVLVSKEKEYILTMFEQIDKTATAQSKFENIAIENSQYERKSNGFNLASVNAPTPTRLEAHYLELKDKECAMFVSSMVNFSDSYSARVNNINIASGTSPNIITKECYNTLNDVVIIKENNMFGVALNTNLEGIHNPIVGINLNPCPIGVCNPIMTATVTPNIPINVVVNKPTVTIPSAITTPTFKLGTPMVQPPVVPPVVTPPPPVVTPPPPPVVTPPAGPTTPVVTPPAGPTTPVTPPPPPPPSAEYEVPYILSVYDVQGVEVGSYQCGTAKIAPNPYGYYYHTEIKDAACKIYYPLAGTNCGSYIIYMPELVTKPTVYYGLLMQIGSGVCGGA